MAERIETEKTVAKSLDNLIPSFDYSDLNGTARQHYRVEAKSVLEAAVFKNELAKLIAHWTRQIAVEVTDYDQVRDVRMCISALEMFKDRLQEVAESEKEPTRDDDPHGAI